MSSVIKNCDKDENDYLRKKTEDRINAITAELNKLKCNSKIVSEKNNNLQLMVNNLKSEVDSVGEKIDQTVDSFGIKFSNELRDLFNSLDEGVEVQSTSDGCCNIVTGLLENLASIGCELNKDMSNLLSLVNEFDIQLKTVIAKSLSKRVYNSKRWFIDKKGRLVKTKILSLRRPLPQFKSGTKRIRQNFISNISSSFSRYKVPEHLWIELTTNQLIGNCQCKWNSAKDVYKNLSWTEFTNIFIETEFNNCNSKSSNNNTDGENCDSGDGRNSTECEKHTTQEQLKSKFNGISDCNISVRNPDILNPSKSDSYVNINKSNDVDSEKNIKNGKAGNYVNTKVKRLKRKRRKNEIKLLKKNYPDKDKAGNYISTKGKVKKRKGNEMLKKNDLDEAKKSTNNDTNNSNKCVIL